MKMTLLTILFGTALAALARNQSPLHFSFGEHAAESGWTRVTPTNFYSDTAGFGYEPGAEISGTEDATSARPFLFSVKLPPGTYAVTAEFDNPGGRSVPTVKAEQRRLMLEKVHIPPGGQATRTFLVNIRTPYISDREHVHLKSREVHTEQVEWDDKLTLEFNGDHPSVRRLTIAPTNVPTVFITGDSTVCDQPAAPWNSWGQMLPRFFKPDVVVANYAESGETVRSSLGARRFEKVFSLMKPGDYLLVQFGHNDMKEKAPDALATYKANLKQIVERTRQLGGTPILVTSMERKAGVEHPTLKNYPQTVRDVAREEHCALIDLNQMSLEFYRALGPDLGKAFVDGTHHRNYGSYELAKCIVEGIQQDNLPLAKSIVADFGHFDPAKPDPLATFEMAVSPNFSSEKPLGN
jgi:lysophospholipase L1-like esterase